MKIPQYQAQSVANTRPLPGPGQGVVDVSGLINGVQRGAQNFQAGINAQEHEAKQLAEVQKRESDRLALNEARLGITNTLSSADAFMNEKFAEAQGKAPADAAGFKDGMMKDYQKWSEEQVKIAPEIGKLELQQHLSQFGSRLANKAFAFEIGQRNAGLKNSYVDGVESDARTLTANPEMFGEVAGRRIAAARNLAGMPGDVKADMEDAAKARLAWAAGSTQVDRNPAGWLQRSKDPNGDMIMSALKPDALRMLNEKASSELERQKAKGAIEADKIQKAAEKAVKDAQSFALTGEKMSDAYVAQLTATTAGTNQYEFARELITVSNRGAGFGAQSIPAQRAAVASAEATARAKGTSPEQQDRLKEARLITQHQEGDYKEDPWAAATRYTGAPAVAPVQFQSGDQLPQVVSQRVPLMGRVEAAAGSAVSPLQPSEVPQVIAKLAELPITKRAEVLGTTGALLDGPHLSALADQLDKGDRPTALMLKLNDMTTAGRMVSELVGKGAQGLKDKTVKRDDTALAGWRAEISRMVRGTLGSEKNEQDVIDAAYYVRASMDLEGDTPAGFTKDSSNERAVWLVHGLPMERGGVKTLLPRTMTQDDFDERLRLPAVTTQIPETVYVRGVAVPGAQFAYRLPTLGMRQDGYGGYIPSSNNAPVTVDQGGVVPLRLKIQ